MTLYKIFFFLERWWLRGRSIEKNYLWPSLGQPHLLQCPASHTFDDDQKTDRIATVKNKNNNKQNCQTNVRIKIRGLPSQIPDCVTVKIDALYYWSCWLSLSGEARWMSIIYVDCQSTVYCLFISPAYTLLAIFSLPIFCNVKNESIISEVW